MEALRRRLERACGAGTHQFTLDEAELGHRAALALGDPAQPWMALNGFCSDLQRLIEGRDQ